MSAETDFDRDREGAPDPARPSWDAPSRWGLLLAALVVVLSIGTPLFGLRALHGSDVLSVSAPWGSYTEANFQPKNYLLGDTVDAVMPAWKVFRRGTEDGRLSRWNPFASGGSPLASSPDPGWFSPLNLPYHTLPLWYAPALAKAIEMGIALLFTFLFLRRVGLGKPAAIVGGLVFVNSGFQVVWTNWPQTHIAALIPALFWAVERAVSVGTLRSALPLAPILAVMLFEGFPVVAAYGVLASGIYALVRVTSQRNKAEGGRRLAFAAAAGIAGVGITAVQLLPFALRLGHLDLGYRVQATSSHLPMMDMATMVSPNALGSIIDGTYFGSPNYIEAQSFVGGAALVLVITLAVLGAARRTTRGVASFFAGAASLAVVLMYVGGPLLGLFQTLPVFSLSSVGRLRSILGFFLAVLAALGFDALLSQRRQASGWWRALRFGLLAGGAVMLVVGGLDALAASRAVGRTRYVAGQALPYLASGGIALAICAMAVLRGVRWRSLVVWAVPALIVFESVSFALHFWPRIDPDRFYPSSPTHAFLARNLGRDRFAATRSMSPGTAGYYGLRSVTGHVFHQPTWAEALSKVDPLAFDKSPTYSFLASELEVASSPVLDRLASRYFVVGAHARVLGLRGPAPLPDSFQKLADRGTIEVPVPSPRVRGLALRVQTPKRFPRLRAGLHAELVGPDGTVIGRGWRRLFPNAKARVAVALTEPAVPAPMSAGWVLRLTLDAPGSYIRLGTAKNGDLAAAVIRSADDGLRVVDVGGAVVYERTRVLPRIRWAGGAIVERDPERRLAMLDSSRLPPTSVVLDEPGPRALGGTARLQVLADDGQQVLVRVRAAGPGYLVLADAIQYGWKATVDDRPAVIRNADHALGAVAIEPGEHLVRFAYDPPGWTPGLFISLASALALLLAGFLTRPNRWRRSTAREAPR